MTRDEFQIFNRGAMAVIGAVCDTLNTFDDLEVLKGTLRHLRLYLAEVQERNEDNLEAMKRTLIEKLELDKQEIQKEKEDNND